MEFILKLILWRLHFREICVNRILTRSKHMIPKPTPLARIYFHLDLHLWPKRHNLSQFQKCRTLKKKSYQSAKNSWNQNEDKTKDRSLIHLFLLSLETNKNKNKLRAPVILDERCNLNHFGTWWNARAKCFQHNHPGSL